MDALKIDLNILKGHHYPITLIFDPISTNDIRRKF